MAKKPTFFKYGFLSSLLGKFGESLYLMNAFLIALGASAFQIGIINGLHTFGMILSQIVGLWYVNLFTSRRKSEIVAMLIIKIPTLIFIWISFTQTHYWFWIIAGAYFFKGMGGQASYLCWFSWMSKIVPKQFRDYFFGTRNVFGQVGKITGFVLVYFVLKLDYPVVSLLGILFIGSYIFYSLGETAMYFFHPDSKRTVMTKNHIFKRMKNRFKDKEFLNFLFWFTILNGVLTVNILYLEYFMIHTLNLAYYWIPLSFIVLAISSAISFYNLRNYFPRITYKKKRFIINSLILISTTSWIFLHNIYFLITSLFFAGFSLGALTLSEKVDLISKAKSNDKEAYYAVFRFMSPLLITILIFSLNFFQFFQFNFYLVFYVTIPLTLLSFLFLKNDYRRFSH